MKAKHCSTPFTLPNGVVVKNRLVKAAMTEGLADPLTNLPNGQHFKLYRRWAEGGVGISLTGNVLVDTRYLEQPRNVVLEKDTAVEPFRKYAAAAKADGCLAIMQISHAGRQCPVSVSTDPVAPSSVPLQLKGVPASVSRVLNRLPRALTEAEISDVIQRFVDTSVKAMEAGFDGVEVHSGHGYLLSSFLSPHVNRRTDQYGGSPENRRRLLLAIVQGIREAVRNPRFCIFVKLNSSDFRRGGLSEEESLEVLKALQGKVDLIEISGGTYENPELLRNVPAKRSTLEREAFFSDFARKARKAVTVPLMLTGGFTTVSGMERALEEDVDFVGLARPLCTNPDIPREILSGKLDKLRRHAPLTGFRSIDDPFSAAISTFWHQKHLQNLGSAHPVDSARFSPNVWWLVSVEMALVYYFDPRMYPRTLWFLTGLGCAAAAYFCMGMLRA